LCPILSDPVIAKTPTAHKLDPTLRIRAQKKIRQKDCRCF